MTVSLSARTVNSLLIISIVLSVCVAQQMLCGSSFCLSGECTQGVCSCPNDYSDCIRPSNTTCSEIPDFCLAGSCNDTTPNQISCDCPAGTVGDRCWPDLCTGNDPCQNQGVCSQTRNSTACQCNACYEGDLCQTMVNVCTSDSCLNGATCTHSDCLTDTPLPFCDCTSGWTGARCALDRDECDNKTSPQHQHKCVNGACNNTAGGYTCDCDSGYEGTLCDEDINECDEASQFYQCYRNHTFNCTNLSGSYNCSCNPGYTGVNCETVLCSEELCNSHGNCSELNNDWTCNCDQFYEDATCSTPGPCLNSPCVNGECSQDEASPGSGFIHSCTCQSGWTNSSNCAEDINECLTDDPCENNSTCSNLDGGYNCTCDTQWTGENCTVDVDECRANSSVCGDGQCTNLVPGFSCDCAGTGYGGMQCDVDVNECVINTNLCNSHGQCNNLPGSYTCTCTREYIGSRCETRNYCGDQCVAENSESCHNLEAAANCTCKEGWVSPDCSIMDGCNSSPCLNGGTCETLPSNDFNVTCRCDEIRYTGETCLDRITAAAPINLVSIIVPIVVAVVVIVIIAVVVCLCLARKKRATRGIYSPSREETVGNRLELGFSLKPPPEERLI